MKMKLKAKAKIAIENSKTSKAPEIIASAPVAIPDDIAPTEAKAAQGFIARHL